MCGQRVPVSNKEHTLVFVLQTDPVFQDTMIVSEMQTTSRPHTRQYTVLRF